MLTPELLTFLRTLPGRCRTCGFHTGEQGHRRGCQQGVADRERDHRRRQRLGRGHASIPMTLFPGVLLTAALLVVGTHQQEVAVIGAAALRALYLLAVCGLGLVALVVAVLVVAADLRAARREHELRG